MRIPLVKPYRAFPELDRFDEETCERFIRCSRGGIAARAIRAVVIVLSVTLAWFVGFWLMFLLDRLIRALLGGMHSTLDIGVQWLMIGVVVIAGLFFGLFVRDAQLRHGIRGVIRRRGTCLYCGYSLLGMVVPPDLKITCPECGQVTVSSPALHELAVDADGRSFVADVAE